MKRRRHREDQIRMALEEMPCVELVERVTDYLEDALSPVDRRRLEQHLADCEGCRAYLEQLRTAVRLTGTLREEDIDPGMRDELRAVFARWRGDV